MFSMLLTVICLVVGAASLLSAADDVNLVQNGDFESGVAHWRDCSGFFCERVPSNDTRFGSRSYKISKRTQYWMGPSQVINTEPGKIYRAEGYIKLLNDKPGTLGQTIEVEIHYEFPDNVNSYVNVALRPLATAADDWIHLQGDFQGPSRVVRSTIFYFQVSDPVVDFVVDNITVNEIVVKNNSDWRKTSNDVIEKIRKSDISFSVSTAAGIDPADVEIQVLQTRKVFPFGTAVNSWQYVDPSKQKYRDFVHEHFNWAVLESALKWNELEKVQGHLTYDRALKTIKGLRDHGLKVRGHNLVWSVPEFIPAWVKKLSGDDLRSAVIKHINETCNLTKGLLEHWDVNNENLHGQWFQNTLSDINYDLELFNITHSADPYPKLFLNDYGVVGLGGGTGAYRDQGLRFKTANVHLYGMGVQSHFPQEQEPNPYLIKQRLDILAEVGVPLWVTELDVPTTNEDKRANNYEIALHSLYGHPAVEGIFFWGFWDQAHYAGEKAALVRGNNLELTPAGRRVFDLFENQWMTDETVSLSKTGSNFTVRGFHGQYEVRVRHHGVELITLKQTFDLGKDNKHITLDVRT